MIFHFPPQMCLCRPLQRSIRLYATMHRLPSVHTTTTTLSNYRSSEGMKSVHMTTTRRVGNDYILPNADEEVALVFADVRNGATLFQLDILGIERHDELPSQPRVHDTSHRRGRLSFKCTCFIKLLCRSHGWTTRLWTIVQQSAPCVDEEFCHKIAC